MRETVAERHFRDRLQSVRQIASLPEPERSAMSWPDHEDLVAICVELSVSGRDLIEKEFGRVFKNGKLTVRWFQERRQVIEELCDSYTQLAQTVKTLALQACQAAGSPNVQDFAVLLDDAIKAVTDAKQNFFKRWLVGSPQEMAESRAAIARGETFDIDEVFAEIAGTDVATWRKSVEEYKLLEQRQDEE